VRVRQHSERNVSRDCAELEIWREMEFWVVMVDEE
jgi:hypothetical protein